MTLLDRPRSPPRQLTSAVTLRAFWKPEQIAAYLGGVPKAKMWLLDLFGDSNPIWPKTESFHGHPYWLCTLLNFGGREYSATVGAPRSVCFQQCSPALIQSCTLSTTLYCQCGG